MTPVFVITIGDILGGIILLLMALFFGYYALKETIKQALCKHDGALGENMRCDAICQKCGKNLGFIGTWRDKQKAKNK